MEHPAADGSVRRLSSVSDVDLRSVGVQRRLRSVAVDRSTVGTCHWNARHGCLARCCEFMFITCNRTSFRTFVDSLHDIIRMTWAMTIG